MNDDGHREILGLHIATALRFAIAPGLPGVQLVISDVHASLVDAIGAVLPGA